MNYQQVDYLADHPLIIAVPAFVPALIVAGVIAWIAVRNRRQGDGAESTDRSDDSR